MDIFLCHLRIKLKQSYSMPNYYFRHLSLQWVPYTRIQLFSYKYPFLFYPVGSHYAFDSRSPLSGFSMFDIYCLYSLLLFASPRNPIPAGQTWTGAMVHYYFYWLCQHWAVETVRHVEHFLMPERMCPFS